jgi:5-methyltetrahydropteroyltriglutamate--homocysteine methyltransferase
VVDVHAHATESAEAVRKRVEQALTIIPKERVWVDPDCGLKTRTVEEAIEKLRVCVTAARAFRH